MLAAAPATSIGDTVTQLRRTTRTAGITPYLGTLHKLQALPAGKRVPVKERELDAIATALGSTPASVEQKLQDVLQVSPEEAKRLRAIIVAPPGGRGKLKAIAAADVAPTPQYAPVADRPVAEAPVPEPIVPEPPTFAPPVVAEAPNASVPPEPTQTFPVAPAAFLDAPLDAATGHNVDVFEELARLPEPLPLGDPSAPLPDLLAAPSDVFNDDPFAAAGPLVATPLNAPPDGAVELVDAGPGALAVRVRRSPPTHPPSTWPCARGRTAGTGAKPRPPRRPRRPSPTLPPGSRPGSPRRRRGTTPLPRPGSGRAPTTGSRSTPVHPTRTARTARAACRPISAGRSTRLRARPSSSPRSSRRGSPTGTRSRSRPWSRPRRSTSTRGRPTSGRVSSPATRARGSTNPTPKR